MIKLLIVETPHKALLTLNNSKETTIVAVNPESVDFLDRNNIPHYIPEDFGYWIPTHKYYQFVADLIIEFFNISMGGMIRGVIDPYIRTYTRLNNILEATSVKKKLYLVGKDRLDDILDDKLFFKGRSLWSRFAEEFDFEIMVIPGGKIKKVISWRDNKLIRSLYDYFRYYRFLIPWKRNEEILFASPMIQMKYYRLKGYYVTQAPIYDERKVLSTKYPEKIFQRIDDYCGSKSGLAKSILKSRFDLFFNEIQPTVYYNAERYEKYLNKNRKRFRMVVFTRRNRPHHYSLLMAATNVGIKTVYFRHGWQAYKMWEDDWSRTGMYDEIIDFGVKIYKEKFNG